MKLEKILEDVEILEKEIDLTVEVEDVFDDSRKVITNSLFIAHKGLFTDGHLYIEEAIKKGCNVIVCEDKEIYFKLKNVNKVLVKDGRKAKAEIAANYYLHPAKQLKMIGVTGSKGKTTSTFMIKNILDNAGIKTGLIGTIYTAIGDKVLLKNRLTTPDSIELQKILRIMVNEGVKVVVMEVSSQALKLDRVHKIKFDIALFTNIYKEHLNKNEHKDMREYLDEKLKLFKNADFGVINFDDFAREEFKKQIKNYYTFGIANKADFNATDINIRSTGVNFMTNINNRYSRITSKIPGSYTVFNALRKYCGYNKIRDKFR